MTIGISVGFWHASRMPLAPRTRVRWQLLLWFLAFTVATVTPRGARAWLFEEHANIGRYAIQHLQRRELDELIQLWAATRHLDAAAERAFCEYPGVPPTHDRTCKQACCTCIDFGALAAAAGDHSCSPDDLMANVTRTDWFPSVYAAVAETERLIHARGASEREKVDAWHQGNLILRRLDVQYLARAANNSAHFVLARGDEDDIAGFLKRAAQQGAPLNATESYAGYHLAALALAAELRNLSPGSPAHEAKAKQVLATEAFALHFLEDSFSAGHFVGLRAGEASSLADRAGTHDYYCEHGLDGRIWGAQRTSYSAHGDAFMSDNGPNSDLEMAAAATGVSLSQVLRVAAGDPLPPAVSERASVLARENVCTQALVSSESAVFILNAEQALEPALDLTPEPYREDPALPHFRSEFGVVLRGAGAYRLGVASDANLDSSNADGSVRSQSNLQGGLGIGLGLEGLTTQTTDGVFWLQGDITGYGNEIFLDCGHCKPNPPRFGWGIRARIPFLLIPGDTLLGLLLVLPVSPSRYEEMAILASQGSYWARFERVRALGSVLNWQIVVGREAALYYSHSTAFGGLRVYELELPLLEFRTKHQFAERLGNDGLVQLGGTVEWDTVGTYGDDPRLTHAGSAYVRFAFDGMYYFYP
jgi:hypothetical protein